ACVASGRVRRATSAAGSCPMWPPLRLAGGSCSGLQRLRGAGGLPDPGQELMQLMVLGAPGDDALQYIGQPGQRIDAVQLACVEQRREAGPVARSTLRSSKE